MKDLVCFADNYVFEVDETQSKINNNELVIGPTRSGKTMSIVEPRLLHTFHSSLVVTVTKRKLVDQYKEIFKKRGYLIIDLDFTNNKNGKSYYDPFQYIKSEEDVIDLADKIVNDKNIPDDPYWYDSAKSILISLISLTYINAKSRNEKPTLQEFIILYNNLQIDYSKNNITSNYDYIFENLNKYYPNNLASSCWKTIKNLASKTASCILSMVNTVIDKLFTKTIVDNTKNKDCIDFIKLVSRKTIMFITTSAVNESANNYIGLMYSDLFKQLITYSERRNDKVLPRPIHIICDDFATGTKIAKLEEYISIFCAKRISITMLLQSESQMNSIYGVNAATTIINNCDTYVYLGGNDMQTIMSISKRANMALDDVFEMPVEKIIVFRRGCKKYVGYRYKTLEDEIYKKEIIKN